VKLISKGHYHRFKPLPKHSASAENSSERIQWGKDGGRGGTASKISFYCGTNRRRTSWHLSPCCCCCCWRSVCSGRRKYVHKHTYTRVGRPIMWVCRCVRMCRCACVFRPRIKKSKARLSKRLST